MSQLPFDNTVNKENENSNEMKENNINQDDTVDTMGSMKKERAVSVSGKMASFFQRIRWRYPSKNTTKIATTALGEVMYCKI